MKRDEALKQVDAGIAKLQEALASGRSEELQRYMQVMSRFHRYSFGNIMLILLQRPDSTCVAGFHRWLELGRHVKKGEQGIGILAPLVYKRKAEEAERDDADPDEKVVRGFKIVHVFDVSQTDGEPLPEFAATSGDPGENLARIEQVIRDAGIELKYGDLPRGAQGSSSGGTITVAEGLSPPERFAVLAHEQAHESLHQGPRRFATTKIIRETEAEAVAYVVCTAFGIEAPSADYIQLHRGNADTLAESLEFIQKTAASIIESINGIELLSSGTHQAQEATGASDEPPTELRTGRADYEERREARIDRYRERADRSQAEAEATYAQARQMAEVIPFGQPILVGHHSEKSDRNYRQRIDRKFGKAFELHGKAKHWEQLADAAENSTAISSDDPAAITKLQSKLASLEAKQRQMKAVNAAWRKAGKPAADDDAGWRKVADHPDVMMDPNDLAHTREQFARLLSWQTSAVPFPSYSLANNSAEIRRVKQRIEQLTTSANAEHVEEEHGICRIVDNADENRVQLIFDGKPPQETRDVLKRHGFRWSRRNGAWQRLLNDAGRQAAQLVVRELANEDASCTPS